MAHKRVLNRPSAAQSSGLAWVIQGYRMDIENSLPGVCWFDVGFPACSFGEYDLTKRSTGFPRLIRLETRHCLYFLQAIE